MDFEPLSVPYWNARVLGPIPVTISHGVRLLFPFFATDIKRVGHCIAYLRCIMEARMLLCALVVVGMWGWRVEQIRETELSWARRHCWSPANRRPREGEGQSGRWRSSTLRKNAC